MAKAESYEATEITTPAASGSSKPAGKGKRGNPLAQLLRTRSGRVVLAVGAAGIMVLFVLVKRGGAADPAPTESEVVSDTTAAPGSDMAYDLGPSIQAQPIPSGGYSFQDYGSGGNGYVYPDPIAPVLSDGVTPAQPLPPVQVIIDATSPSVSVAGNQGSATGSPGVAKPPPTPPAQAQEIARWTPPAGIKPGGATDIAGATFLERVKLSNGQFAPIIKYKSTGQSQIHPSWQRWMAANKVTRA